MNRRLLHGRSLFLVLLLVSLLFSFSFGEDDTRCLQEVKNSLTDPEGKLNSWVFSNTTVGFICKFVGVSCWNDRENRLIGLELRDFSLTGSIPDSLQFCHSLQTLNLADDNKLSGNIPYQLSSLGRLKKFSVANNDLSGRVPSFNYELELDFGGNSGLCGGPLGKCGGLSKKSMAIIIAAGVFGAAASLLLGFGLWWWYFMRSNKRSKKGYGIGRRDDGSSWADICASS
ncbi:UNVERIFIED_CONTAM: Inactive LRR receptor-like serine/threonine-protein kinase BIR2 [Sesamum radiatum]|uniref:Inactive LRR receptor-like serine/threonine-protein kinase BIR2 n=1 Tax=Sesamum radiatum TaxID=300843 RepID=A0AAW2RBV0_SESRA